MGKKYKIKYLGRGHTIDVVDARSKKAAIRSLFDESLFIAEEVKFDKK